MVIPNHVQRGGGHHGLTIPNHSIADTPNHVQKGRYYGICTYTYVLVNLWYVSTMCGYAKLLIVTIRFLLHFRSVILVCCSYLGKTNHNAAKAETNAVKNMLG